MQKPKLLDQVRNLMRLKHLSHKTERAYVAYNREYILFHGKRHPKDMGAADCQPALRLRNAFDGSFAPAR